MAFESDTYICLDVPDPHSSEVMAIRRRHLDEFRSALPVEITVAGSSGVGVIESAQDPAEVFGVINSVAADSAPITARFGEPLRFPGTDIFVLTLEDRVPFEALHARLATSGIRFKPSPHGFFPHCTLRSRSPVTNGEADDLLGTRIEGGFVLSELVLYMLDKLPMSVLHRVPLTGRSG